MRMFGFGKGSCDSEHQARCTLHGNPFQRNTIDEKISQISIVPHLLGLLSVRSMERLSTLNSYDEH